MFTKRTGSCATHAGPLAGGRCEAAPGIVGPAGMNAIRLKENFEETHCKGSGSRDEEKNFRSKN